MVAVEYSLRPIETDSAMHILMNYDYDWFDLIWFESTMIQMGIVDENKLHLVIDIICKVFLSV